MRVLCSTAGLVGHGGSESYLVTVGDHLQRLGHDVWLHALELGPAAEDARRLGLRVTGELADVGEPDVALVQDGAVSLHLAARLPGVPQVFVAHSDVFDLQLPPQVPGVVAAVVTLYDRVDARVAALAHTPPATRLRQPVDVDRFKPLRALPQRPRRAVALGNYVHSERLALLRAACTDAGIEFHHVGQHGAVGTTGAPQEVLQEADIVFGKARVAVEAMACGCAVYVYDVGGAEGWVTAERYPVLAADNFGGRRDPVGVSAERLRADLTAYHPAMGLANRDLAVTHHAATQHVAALTDVLRAAAPGSPATPGTPLEELSRLVRLYHRADAHAWQLQDRHTVLSGRLDEVAREAEAARQHAAGQETAAAAAVAALEGERRRAEHDLTAARGEAARQAVRAAAAEQEAHEARLALEALRSTRRWLLVQRALGPADRVRRRAAGLRQAAAALDRRRPAAPSAAPAPSSPPPAPFIVGVGRSGTTLLRLQLDAHPLLAIGPETGWGLAVAGLPPGAGPDELLQAVAALETWPDTGLDREEMRARLRAVDPWSVGAGLRVLYRADAVRHGKPRWGDKTPLHCVCMPAIAAALPEARFVHLIRDGRDVAASFRGLPFAPGDGSITAIARAWDEQIGVAQEAGRRLERYREVRFEQLVCDPEETLRELAGWLHLPWDDAMLRAHEGAAARFDALPEARPAGDAVRTRAERRALHALSFTPPDPARVGAWRSALTPAEVAEFEAVAGARLAALGYA